MTYYYASFSGGKDSTAMVLRLLEENKPLNEVIFCDTGMEFPEIYTTVSKVRKMIEDRGIKFTELRSEKSFEYYMFEHPVTHKTGKYKGVETNGLGWPGVYPRWCTGNLKTKVIHKYIKTVVSDHKDSVAYVGLAYDERESPTHKQSH